MRLFAQRRHHLAVGEIGGEVTREQLRGGELVIGEILEAALCPPEQQRPEHALVPQHRQHHDRANALLL